MSTGIYEKILRPARTMDEVNDAAHSERLTQTIQSIGLLLPGAILEEERKELNKWTLSDGAYGAFDHEKPNGHIRGLSPGSVFNKRCVIRESATIIGVEFNDDEAEAAPELVHIIITGDPIRVMFIGCTFRRSAATLPQHLLVDSGAKVIFLGCTFLGDPSTAGDLINHTGAAINIQAVACMNHTNNSFGTVTQTASL